MLLRHDEETRMFVLVLHMKLRQDRMDVRSCWRIGFEPVDSFDFFASNNLGRSPILSRFDHQAQTHKLPP
jgi:hypothetical protein